MAKKKFSNNFKFVLGIIIALLIAVGSWAIFNLAKLGIDTILIDLGVVNPVYQLLVLIGIVVVLLLILGYSFKDSLKKLVR